MMGVGTEIEGGYGGTPPINRRSLVSLSPIDSGVGEGKILGAKCPKFGVEGAVLEDFGDILENCGI